MMNDIQIRKVDSSYASDFVLLQNDIPIDPRYFVDKDSFAAILNKRDSEFTRVSWMAYLGKEPVAFVTTSIDRLAPTVNEQPVAFFTNFVSKNNAKAVDTLFKHIGEWCENEDVKVLRGPMSSSLSDYRGILVSGFDEPPCLGLFYNPDYYGTLLESSGLIKAMDLYSYRIETGVLKKVSKVAKFARIRNPRLKIRNFDMNNIDNEIREVVSIYNKSWKGHWSFIPVDEGDFKAGIGNMNQFFDPEMVKLAEIDGKMVGVMVSVPNMFDANVINTGVPVYARAMLFGVDSSYQRRGIDALLMDAAISMCKEKGVLEYEVGWVLESNVLWRKQLETACKDYLMGIRKYRMFEYHTDEKN